MRRAAAAAAAIVLAVLLPPAPSAALPAGVTRIAAGTYGGAVSPDGRWLAVWLRSVELAGRIDVFFAGREVGPGRDLVRVRAP